MKTGIFSLPSSAMTFQMAVDYALELGVDAIEPYPHAEFIEPDVEAARRLADYAGGKNVGICCFSLGADFLGSDIEDEVARLKRYADVAAALGSPYLHHTLAPALDFASQRFPFSVYLERAVRGVREVYDYAEQLGVRCIYEEQGFAFNGVGRFDDFLGAVNRPVGVLADLGNILFVGESPEQFVSRFAPMVCHVHAKDYLYKDCRWPHPGNGWYESQDGGYLRGTVIGHGTVNFVRVCQVLQSVGYDGFYSLEYDGLEDPYLAQNLGLDNLRRYGRIAGVERKCP